MKTSETIKAILPDFVKAISEIAGMKKDSTNPFFKNKYISLDGIIEASKPVLAKHNLAAFQSLSDEGIETVIIHASGEWISSGYLRIPAEQGKGLSLAQSVGVATTYAKRYQLASMLEIASDEDTDGNIEQPKQPKPEPKHVPDAAKSVLLKSSPEWGRAVDFLANGGLITQIEKKYIIRTLDREDLLSEAAEKETNQEPK